MAKQSVLNRPHVTEPSGRNAFDRSKNADFNQVAGMLGVCFCDFFQKGSKGVINRKVFTRTQQVLYPGFQQITEHMDFVKIPIRYLWSPYNDWSLNIFDINSSAMKPQVSMFNQQLPVLPQLDFGSKLYEGLNVDLSSAAGAKFDQSNAAHN